MNKVVLVYSKNNTYLIVCQNVLTINTYYYNYVLIHRASY